MSDLNLEKLFGSQSVDFTCPGCNHTFNVKFRELLREGNIIVCPKCGQRINIQHEAETTKSIRDDNRALRDFQRTLEKFGK